MAEKKTLSERLSEDLEKDAIKKRVQGNREVSYLEGWYVKQQANEIFGIANWSYTVKWESMKHIEMEPVPVRDKQGDVIPGKFNARGKYMAPVSLTVKIDGETVTREDVGVVDYVGEVQKDTAIKGAVTDGLKRAFASFGRQFGLNLYDKDELAEIDDEDHSPYGGNPAQVTPKCVNCGRPMSLRNGSRGPFWGCTGYPKCKTTYNSSEVSEDGTYTPKKDKKAVGPSADDVKEGKIEELTIDNLPF